VKDLEEVVVCWS